MSRGQVVVAIQARTGSSRLPGKVLMDLAGRPMLRFQIERLAPVAAVHPVVVATSDLDRDDAVEQLARDAGCDVVRGSEPDVLGRFGLVLDRYQPDHIVRLTGDCPLTDPAIVSAVIDLHLAERVDYTSNIHPRSFPKGLDVEAVSAPALAAAVAEATEPYDREHVTPFVVQHPERFPRANLGSGNDLGSLWWTVDTETDLETVRDLLAGVGDPVGVGWRDLLPEGRQVSTGRRGLPR